MGRDPAKTNPLIYAPAVYLRLEVLNLDTEAFLHELSSARFSSRLPGRLWSWMLVPNQQTGADVMTVFSHLIAGRLGRDMCLLTRSDAPMVAETIMAAGIELPVPNDQVLTWCTLQCQRIGLALGYDAEADQRFWLWLQASGFPLDADIRHWIRRIHEPARRDEIRRTATTPYDLEREVEADRTLIRDLMAYLGCKPGQVEAVLAWRDYTKEIISLHTWG